MSDVRPAAGRSSPWARLGLVLLGIGLGLSTLLVAEGVLRLAGVPAAQRDPFAGFGATRPVFTRAQRADGTPVWRTDPARGLPHVEEFLVEKPPGAFRVFVVGESSAAGVPYPASQAFSAWLARRLVAALPGRVVEVVNAAVPGYASRRVLGVVRELAAVQPDLLIVYCGHNEFAESRQYAHLLAMDPRLFRLRALAATTRLYGALERALGWDKTPRVNFDDIDDAGQMFAVADERLAGKAYADERERRWGELHYRWNLEEMAGAMRAAGARTLFVSLGQNFADWAPGASAHRGDLRRDERERWERLVAAARGDAASGDCALAIPKFEQALAVDDEVAQAHFELARCAEQLGDAARAARHYRRASDLDRVPHGAPSAFDSSVREVARDTDSLFLDGGAVLATASARPLPGDDLFVDAMHPNLHANQLLAAAIAETLRDAGIPEDAGQWRTGYRDPPVGGVLAGDPTLRRQERLVRAASCVLARRDACALAELEAVLAQDPDHAWARQLRAVIRQRASSAAELPPR